MMQYSIITKKNAFEALEIDDEAKAEAYRESMIEEQDAKLETIGVSVNGIHLIHFFDSEFSADYTEEMTIDNAIQCLALKEGCDLVRFENGNTGYIGYYGIFKNGFEIIA